MGTGGVAPFGTELLLPHDELREEDGSTLAGLFPFFNRDELWQGIAELLYTQHGGSGLNLTLADIMELDYDRLFFMLEFLGDKRSEEAAAIKKASGK